MVLHSVVARCGLWFPSMSCLELEALPHTRPTALELQVAAPAPNPALRCAALHCAGLQRR